SAHQEVVTAFEHGLVALQHLPDERHTHEQGIDLRLDLCVALLLFGEYGHILVHMRAAEPLATALGDQRRLSHISARMCGTLLWMGDNDGARAAGQRALALATAVGDLPLVAQAQARLGNVYHMLGDYTRALDCLRQAVEATPSSAHLGTTSPFPVLFR